MINIHNIVDESVVDGEGYRMAIFTQGCKHNCKGCHNPNTHSFEEKHMMKWEEIYARIKEMPWLDGITLTGGDPFFQASELIQLVKACKSDGLSVWAYTGFVYEDFIDITRNSEVTNDMIELLKHIDVLVDGRFNLEQRTLEQAFVGSRNQRIIDVQASLKENKVIRLRG